MHNEDGTANWVAGGFVAGFTIVVVWVVLQVYMMRVNDGIDAQDVMHSIGE